MAVLAMACGSGAPADGGPSDAAPHDACATCASDSGLDGDDSFATARPLSLGERVSGVLDPPGDLDYYTFRASAGQWVGMFTIANPDDVWFGIDTVLTVYDASMTRIAENDDGIPRTGTDSELVLRIPATGTYYVLVQEWSSWAGETPVGMPSYAYELGLFTFTGDDFFNFDHEAGDDAASAQALSYDPAPPGAGAVIVGEFERASDVDVYSFSVPASATPWQYFVYVMPSGPAGNGSSATAADARITSFDGTEILARIDPRQVGELTPPLGEGDYLLWIEHEGSLGPNDFYVLKTGWDADTPGERDELGNDTPTGAEEVAFAEIGPGTRAGFLLAHLGDADVDHFRIRAMEGERLLVVCGSRTSGSGVLGMRATLLDAGGSTLATSVETASASIRMELAPPGAGEYVLRLAKEGQDPDIASDWVRCGIRLQVPLP